MSHRRCPACGQDGGGRTVTELALRTPDGHPLKDGYRVVCCSACGTGFADVVVPGAYYEQYYRSLAKYAGENAVYRNEDEVEAPVDPDWRIEKADDSARRIDALLGRRGARVLDVGCSTGAILGALSRLGYEHLEGVDPSAESVRLARARPFVHATVGTFASLPGGLGGYDCICITGVLEHLWEVDLAIAAVLPLLSPGGIIYIEVPDAGRYLDPYVSPYEDFNTEHVNHLSFRALRRIAGRLGLRTLSEVSYLAPITEGVQTGCAAVAWGLGEGSPTPSEARDDELEATLFAFAERSAADFALIEEVLCRELAGFPEYVLWGVGEAAFKLLALRPLSSRRASAYVDGNAARRGFRLGGMPVLEPSAIASGSVPIVASSLNRAGSIVTAAAQLGLENPVLRLDGWKASASAPR